VGQLNRHKNIISLGFMLGIGGIVTYKNSGLQKVVEAISLNHLVLETDSPWLTRFLTAANAMKVHIIPLLPGK